jgi:hypothetical protein
MLHCAYKLMKALDGKWSDPAAETGNVAKM